MHATLNGWDGRDTSRVEAGLLSDFRRLVVVTGWFGIKVRVQVQSYTYLRRK